MKTGFSFVLSAALISSISGCSSSKDGDDSIATNPQEALQRLSDQQRAAFETWKSSLIKSCDAAEAFGVGRGSRGDSQGLDAKALLERNAKSSMIQMRGGFALLGSLNSMSGTEVSKTENMVDVNGSRRVLKAESRRDGSECSLSLYGVEVFKTYVARSVDLLAASDAGNGDESRKLDPVRTTPAVEIRGTVARVNGESFVDAIRSAIAPTRSTYAEVAQYYGISEDQAQAFFKTSPFYATASYQISNRTLWISPSNSAIYGPVRGVQEVFAGQPQSMSVDARISLPSLSYAGSGNEADSDAYLALRVTLSNAPSAERAGEYLVQVKSIEAAKRSLDKDELAKCVSARFSTLKNFFRSDVTQLQPSLKESYSTCEALSKDARKEVFSAGIAKSLVAGALAGVTPSATIQYNDWDDVAYQLAVEAQEKGKDIVAELDPLRSAPIISELDQNLTRHKALMSSNPELSKIEDRLRAMAARFAFVGRQVADSKMQLIYRAANQSVKPFEVSTARLVQDLAANPDSHEGELSFALGLDANYKDQALKAEALAAELESRDFYRVFERVLQDQPSVEVFKSWQTKLSTVKAQLAQSPNLAPARGRMTQLALKWMDSGATQEQVKRAFSALNNVYVPFVDSTEALMTDLTNDISARQQDLDFAAGISQEYKQVAQAFVSKAAELELEDWAKGVFKRVLQDKTSLQALQAWNATLEAAKSFSAREKARLEGESFTYTNDRYRKEIIQTALKESWTNSEFVSLEQIAAFGSQKIGCSYQKGYSSIANCVGLGMFSRASGKFFDPKFGLRYGKLAEEFTGYVQQLGQDFLKDSLIREFFGGFEPIWSRCASSMFEAKAGTLRFQVPAYSRESDFSRKWDLERTIKASLQNCTQ